MVLGVYVDDLVPVSNDPAMLKEEKAALCNKFEMVDQGEIHYLLGMSIKRDRKLRTLTISQPTYRKFLRDSEWNIASQFLPHLNQGRSFRSFQQMTSHLIPKSINKQSDA